MSAYGIVRGLGRAWVRVYTAGLPREDRERRRDEIDSDLYEYESERGYGGMGAVGSRFVRGVPADIAWRVERSMHTEMEDDLVDTWPGLIAVVLVLAIAVTSLVYAILHVFGYFGDGHRIYGLIQVGLLVASLVLLRGLSMTGESPRAGAALVLVVGLGMAFMWAFMPPIAIALLLVVAYGMKRAWDSAHEGAPARRRISSGRDSPPE